ncbi:MAG: urea transporter [Bosea sp.]|uniref:urea transporter n=1 Tax=Bosea sp. (in: a-proteobacteria) TaxID=1871050 RepID=UPI001ACB251A|nr:urea transporter [Bosea sp. (in: a-proteobacteria)]MBN9471984.1 urea transporter [Bosea sp. (in: a-proteobacteria)]
MAVLRLSTTGLEVHCDDPLSRLAGFLDSVLRGVGQVMFQNNSYAGLLFLIGIAYNSWLFAVAVLVGTVASTLTAIVLGADRILVRSGMFGFNGGLVGVALLYFLQPVPLTWACVILAAACCTIVMAAMLAAFDIWKLPALTAPFVFISLCFFLATARFGRLETTGFLPTAGLPKAAAVEGVASASTIAEGLFNGVSQVFFQGSATTGMLFAAGLLVASRMAFAAGLAGSLAGLLVAWGMGAAEPAIRAGAFGFNSLLVAIALAGTFLTPSWAAIAYALLGAIATPFVAAAAAAALEPLGMPALTLPFVLVTWIFLLASRRFPKFRAKPTA